MFKAYPTFRKLPPFLLSEPLRMEAGSLRNVGYVLNIGDSGKVLVNYGDITQVKSFSKIYSLQ